MNMRTILTPLSGGDSDSAVLDAALAIAQRFNAHIDVLHARVDPREAVPFLGEGASGALIQQIMEATQRDASTRATRARAAFDAWRKRAGIPLVDMPDGAAPSVAWHEELGPEDELVARRGRLSDLIVVPQPSGEGGVVSTVSFEAALLDTGRPVLAVPQKAGALALLEEGPALIAWNGSIESSRAIWAALPFLSTARRVTILSVMEGGTAADAAQVRAYLGWHGIKAEVMVPDVKTSGVGAQVLAEAEARQAGLLVMGAYTRSRLRRMVFGGVTEHVLANAQLPVLMVH